MSKLHSAMRAAKRRAEGGETTPDLPETAGASIPEAEAGFRYPNLAAALDTADKSARTAMYGQPESTRLGRAWHTVQDYAKPVAQGFA
jgi:hypothetical protein